MRLLINFRLELLKKFRNIPLKFTFCFLGRHAFSLPRLLPDRNSTNHRALFQLFASTWRKRCCYSTVRLQGLKDEKHCSVTQSATMLRGFFIGGTWIGKCGLCFLHTFVIKKKLWAVPSQVPGMQFGLHSFFSAVINFQQASLLRYLYCHSKMN